MKNVVGAIVEKENFFGRKKEIKHAWEQLSDGSSLMLAASRRVGKSSFANKIEDLNNVSFFLHWLRGLRQEHIGSKIRWIFCSSVSIQNFAHKYNLSDAFNDIEEFQIDELKGDEPIMLVKELAKSKKMDFPDAEIQYLLTELVWKLPYYIQLMLKEIGDLVDNETVSKKIIDLAIKNATSTKSIRFNTWIERLKNYGDDKPYALLLLKELSKIKSGLTRENLQLLIYDKVKDMNKAEDILNRLLLMLENEGYIMKMRGKYTFHSPLLRMFCYNRHIG